MEERGVETREPCVVIDKSTPQEDMTMISVYKPNRNHKIYEVRTDTLKEEIDNQQKYKCFMT